LVDATNDILLRPRLSPADDRTEGPHRDLLPEHLGIIEALEARDTEVAEKRARDHTLGLATYVEAHGHELFT
jgi:DNA-binding GntR family transcriptional regulator